MPQCCQAVSGSCCRNLADHDRFGLFDRRLAATWQAHPKGDEIGWEWLLTTYSSSAGCSCIVLLLFSPFYWAQKVQPEDSASSAGMCSTMLLPLVKRKHCVVMRKHTLVSSHHHHHHHHHHHYHHYHHHPRRRCHHHHHQQDSEIRTFVLNITHKSR